MCRNLEARTNRPLNKEEKKGGKESVSTKSIQFTKLNKNFEVYLILPVELNTIAERTYFGKRMYCLKVFEKIKEV